MDKNISFTLHAEEKLLRLAKIGITREKVLEAIRAPEKIFKGYYGRKIAQNLFSSDLVLRVVFEETEDEIIVITIYPGEGRRYE